MTDQTPVRWSQVEKQGRWHAVVRADSRLTACGGTLPVIYREVSKPPDIGLRCRTCHELALVRGEASRPPPDASADAP